MSNMAAKLKQMEMEISDGFLVHLIVTSLPPKFLPFTMNYNAMKIKWSIDELMARCAQEEERLRAKRVGHVNHVMKTEKKRYEKFMKEYMPKPAQFKKKGQSSKQNQQNKPENGSSAEDKPSADPKGCHWCGKPGYIKKDCIGFLKWLNKKGTDIISFIDESLYANYATNT